MKSLIVSTALDTNGQNARYVRAAERWGDDPDVLGALVVGLYDPANVGNRFAQAAERHGGLSIRAAHSSEAYFKFPRDIFWTRGNHREVQALADECDVIHLNNSARAYFKLRMPRQRKPALLHHHGTLFRNDPDPLLYDAKRFAMVQCVSTIDLQKPAPDLLHWLPTAYNLEELAAIRAKHRRLTDDGVVRIVSAPTHREWKSTDRLIAAVERLKAEGLPVKLVLIESQPWDECLRLKATADIYFDQVKLGYGCNAIEAWGMGIPVVAGADEWTLGRMVEEYRGPIPFYQATEDTILDALRALVTSKRLRSKWARIGKEHAEKFHAEKPALRRLAELYALAIAKRQAATEEEIIEFPLAPGRFRTTLRPRLVVPIGNQRVSFTDGEVHIANPALAQKMRMVAVNRPRFQVQEIEGGDAA